MAADNDRLAFVIFGAQFLAKRFHRGQFAIHQQRTVLAHRHVEVQAEEVVESAFGIGFTVNREGIGQLLIHLRQTHGFRLLNRLLIAAVEEFAGKPESVLDLYCGNGNLSLGMAAQCRVVGMDHNRDAARAARKTKIEGAEKHDYRKGGEDKMTALIASGEFETILLDPPRAGAKLLAPALAACQARQIVYVSCDPATLARDVKVMAAQGWSIVRAAALDMFPNTPHVETVCLLRRSRS